MRTSGKTATCSNAIWLRRAAPSATCRRRCGSRAAAEQTAAVKSRQAAEAALAETRQALEKERQNSELLERDLTAARRSIGDLQAKVAATSSEQTAAEQTAAAKSRQAAEAALAETSQALEKERQNSEVLERDLTAARLSIGDLQAKVVAAEQRAAKQTAAEQTAADQREAVKSRRAAEAALAETRQALEKERQNSELLERDLTAARRSIGDLQAKIAAAETASKQTAAEQREAAKSRQAAEAALAEVSQAIEQERQSSELVERDLTAARRSIGDLQAKVAAAETAAKQTAAEHTAAEQTEAVKSRHAAEAALEETSQALEQERQSSELLERDLTAARRSIGDLQAKIEPAATEQREAAKSRQAAEAALAETTQALEKERQNSELLERDLAAARRSIGDLRARIEPAAAEQTEAVKSRQAAEAALAETRQALEKERQNSELLERDLTAARRSIGGLQAKAAAAKQTATRQTAADQQKPSRAGRQPRPRWRRSGRRLSRNGKRARFCDASLLRRAGPSATCRRMLRQPSRRLRSFPFRGPLLERRRERSVMSKPANR